MKLKGRCSLKKKIIIWLAVAVSIAVVIALTALLSVPSGTVVKTDEEIDARLSEYKENGDAKGAISLVSSIEDEKVRKNYTDALYDKESPVSINIGNTPSNHAGGAVMAFSGDDVFFCDPENYRRLYKLSNGEKTLLVSSRTSYLNVVGEYIYFINETEDYGIYKMKHDGSELSEVGDVSATGMIVLGDTIYFINWRDEQKPYSMDIDGNNLKKISDVLTDPMYICGNKLFFCNFSAEEPKTVAYALDSGIEETFLTETAYFITGYDRNVFYRSSTDMAIWNTEIAEEPESVKIYEARAGHLIPDSKYIYFVDFDKGNSVMRMNHDGSGAKKLSSDSAKDLSENGEWLYYFNENDGKKLYRIGKNGEGRECLEK